MFDDNTFADTIRLTMREGVSDLTTQPDLLPGLRKSYARRMAVRRAGVVAAPLAVAAAVGMSVTVSADGPNAPGRSPTPHIQDAAYLTAQITRALDGVDHDIFYTVSQNRTDDGYVSVEHMWELANGSANRDEEFHNGQPFWDDSHNYTIAQELSVDYPSRTYTVAPLDFCFGSEKCDGAPLPSGLDPVDIKQVIASGDLKIVGQGEVVNGQSAIHLQGSDLDIMVSGGVIDLWVSESSYLPIRYTLTGGSNDRDADITVLPPTKENLAQLIPTIPPGFTKGG